MAEPNFPHVTHIKPRVTYVQQRVCSVVGIFDAVSDKWFRHQFHTKLRIQIHIDINVCYVDCMYMTFDCDSARLIIMHELCVSYMKESM